MDGLIRERFARPALAAGGGFLVALSMPPWGFWPLAFAGVAALAFALGHDLGWRRRAECGFAFGVPWFCMGMGWMWFLTVPGYVIAVVLFASLHAAAGALAGNGPWRTVARPAAHTLVEAVRLSFPFGGVPLATLAIGQAGGPLLGVARVGGVVLITWIVLQLGFAVGAVASSRAPLATDRPLLAALAATVVVVLISAVAPHGRDVDAAPLTIAAVQGGGEQGTRALDVPSSQVTRAHLDATATIGRDDGVDLVVWPENGIDVDGRDVVDSEQYALVAAEAERLGVPFAVGVTIDSEFSQEPRPDGFVNAQIVVAPDGTLVSGYEKVRIVPFGEYVPLRGLLDALGAPLDQIPSDAVRGTGPAVIELPDGTLLGVMISWEVFFGDRGRAGRSGAILLNPTNGASYTGTILQTQQVASSKLRAVENGRWIVQVSPTGFSAFVSPSGDVYDRTGVSERAVIVRGVPRRDGSTWYSRLGDWPWTVAVALTAVGATIASRRVTPRSAA